MTTELSPGEVDPVDLARWLLENGYAEEKAGYGYVTADELAVALHKEYLIYRAYREQPPVAQVRQPTAEELREAAEWRQANFPGITHD